jgi:hypothetical protein
MLTPGPSRSQSLRSARLETFKRKVRPNHFTKWPRAPLGGTSKTENQGARLKRKGLPAEVGGSLSNIPGGPREQVR